MLGCGLHLRSHVGGGREAIPRHGDQGPAWSVRDEARQGQQGRRRLQHHVRRGPVPPLPARALEVPQDGRQQALRVHARATPRRAGHGGGHLPEDLSEVPAQVRCAASGRGDALRRRALHEPAADHPRPRAWADARLLRGARPYDLGAGGRRDARPAADQAHGVAQPDVGGDPRPGQADQRRVARRSVGDEAVAEHHPHQ
mmetsp:Transcript_20808/g.44704  ORF Transcript_20808/g.44704 Transcript_20808/m.44704 type:complete len:200 (-) Transcript_20808:1146-1745(-)